LAQALLLDEWLHVFVVLDAGHWVLEDLRDGAANAFFQESASELLPLDQVLLPDLDDVVSGSLVVFSLPVDDVVALRDDLEVLSIQKPDHLSVSGLQLELVDKQHAYVSERDHWPPALRRISFHDGPELSFATDEL
jgi:hypothetical protein